MKTLVIGNPTAGRGRAGRVLPGLVRALADSGAQPTLRMTSGPGEAVQHAAAAATEGVELVVAAGGDGTVHEVVNGLLSTGRDGLPELAHLPTGTGCDFARALGLPSSPHAVAAGLLAGTCRQIDVGYAEPAAAGSARRWFVNGINVGLGAGVVRRLTGASPLRVLGRHAYLAAAALEVLRARPVELVTWADDGSPLEQRLLHLSICNGGYTGGGMRIPGGASLESGRLLAVRVDPLPRLAALLQLRLAMQGRIQHRAIRSDSCARLRVEGATAGFEIDGELCSASAFVAGVRARALRVRVPQAN